MQDVLARKGAFFAHCFAFSAKFTSPFPWRVTSMHRNTLYSLVLDSGSNSAHAKAVCVSQQK
jgi:hypothetical protein